MKFKRGKIAKFRKERGFNRGQLATKMKDKIPTITRETIRGWETGRTVPRETYFKVLCKALNRKAEDFYDIGHSIK